MTPEGAGPGTGHRSGKAWQGFRKLSSRTPLRIKLITALLALVAIALAVIGFVTVEVYSNYLRGQTDSQVGQLLGQAEQDPNRVLSHSFLLNNSYVGVFTTNGQLLAGNGTYLGATAPSFPTSGSWLEQNSGHILTVPARSGASSWRIAVQQESDQPGQPLVFVVGMSLGNFDQNIAYLTKLDVIVSLAILLVLGVVGVAVVRTNLRPLDDIEQTAEEIAAGHLSRRVPERDPRTELGSLGRSLNIMLSQIEAAFHAREESEDAAHRSEERMRRFVADASHELRTPVTAIRGFAEYYRQRGGLVRELDSNGSGQPGYSGELSAADLDRIMHRVEAEAARMGLLVEDLLLLARMDQQRPLDLRPLDLLTLAADSVQDTRLLAPDRRVELDVRPGAFLVNGDEPRLRQVIGNLMSNALTHTPKGTPVTVRLATGTLAGRPGTPSVPAAVLDVSDSGPGLTPEQADRVFERFYRADQARTRKSGGSGLGLAIVSSLIAAHGGTVCVLSTPGEGATFRVMLPLAPEAMGTDSDDPDDDHHLDAPSEERWLRR